MAAGDRLLDASGNVILDSSGRVQLSDGSANTCCCCGGPPTSATVTVTIADISYNICVQDGALFSANRNSTDTNPNGTYDLTYQYTDGFGTKYWSTMDDSTFLAHPETSSIVITLYTYATADTTCSTILSTETIYGKIDLFWETNGNAYVNFYTDKTVLYSPNVYGWVVHMGSSAFCKKSGDTYSSTSQDDSFRVHFTGLTANITLSW